MVTKNVKINEPYYGTLHLHKRISWSAILIGAFVGIGLTFLLNLFCVALGVSVFTVGNDGAIALVVGGIISMLVGIIASMVAAGYAAGYLGRFLCPQRNLGILLLSHPSIVGLNGSRSHASIRFFCYSLISSYPTNSKQANSHCH